MTGGMKPEPPTTRLFDPITQAQEIQREGWMEAPTPETDAALIDNDEFYDWGHGKSDMVRSDFARRLERERDAARAELAALNKSISKLTDQ